MMRTTQDLKETNWRMEMALNSPPTENRKVVTLNRISKLLFAAAFLFLSNIALNAAAENTVYLKSVAITDAAGSNAPPTAVITYSKSGDYFNFDASSSSDPDGSLVSYKWDFGDGVLVEGATVNTKLATDPAQVTLTVVDNLGGVAITQMEVTAYSDPFEIIADDADATVFKTSGSWSQSTSSLGYYKTGYKTAPAGTGSSTATWSFQLPTSGLYNIFTYYTAYHNRASNAPFIISNNGKEIVRVAVNQQINGQVFFPIGSYMLTKGTLEVTLTNGGNGYSIADAVKVVFNP